jgi:hypothetical protein
MRADPAAPVEPWRSFLEDLDGLERNAERDREDVLRLAAGGHLDPQVLGSRYHEELRPYLLNKHSWHDKTLELWLEMAWPSRQKRGDES